METATLDGALDLQRDGEFDFAKPQFRALLRDGRLSFAARGLFQFLWDLPRGWRPNRAHLVKMSGAGKDALARLRRELEAVGGIRIEAIRLTTHEAEARNAANPDRPRPFRAGQVVGTRWVLRSPHLWAVETPLTPENDEKPCGTTVPPSAGKPDSRSSRLSENPPQRFTKGEGSASTTTTPVKRQAVPDSDLVDLRRALVAQGERLGKGDPAAWAAAALRRIRKDGIDEEAAALLEEWRRAVAAKRQREEAEAARKAQRAAPLASPAVVAERIAAAKATLAGKASARA